MKIGILGAGQLGRMLALAGYPLDLRFRCFDNDVAPAGDVAELMIGEFDDPAALAAFASGLNVVTYEFENVPVASARALEQYVPVFPPPDALEIAQDRLSEKLLFERLKIQTPRFAAVDSRDELRAAVAEIGLPSVLKTRRMGYDGKGQMVLRTAEDVAGAWGTLGGASLILEGFVPFDRELSILAVRGRDGAKVFYPLVHNEHRSGILHLSRAPAPDVTSELQARAEELAGRILEAVGYVGMLALELFQVGADLLANEMAPRVHNSGHWTIEGAVCSQFENHLRAIAGLPLGSTAVRGYSAMVNLIGAAPTREALLAVPGARVHLYGKAPRPGRKLGHVTVCEATPKELDEALGRMLSVVSGDTDSSCSHDRQSGPS